MVDQPVMPVSEPPNLKSQEIRTYLPPTEQEAKWMFDYYMLLLEIKAQLSGGQVNKGNNGYFVDNSTYPFMNELGVQETMALVQAFVHKISAITNYDDDRIYDTCLKIALYLDDFYYVNMEKFELSIEKYGLVKSIVMQNLEANLRKSLDHRSMDVLGQTEKTVTQRVEAPKKFGIF